MTAAESSKARIGKPIMYGAWITAGLSATAGATVIEGTGHGLIVWAGFMAITSLAIDGRLNREGVGADD